MKADEAIVLVGGLGTRLRAVVSDVPKPLAPVAGRPFLVWVLDHLADSGMRRVVLATGYMADKVRKVVGRQWREMEIAYAIEETPLGTGGAVRHAVAGLRGSSVHVLNGDTFLRYSPLALERATRRSEAAIGIALAEVTDVSRYGAVDIVQGKVTSFHGNGQHGLGWINAGCYFLTEEALSALPREAVFSFETSVLVPQAREGKVAGFTETDGFIDIGVPEDYRRAQTLFGVHV